MGILDGKVALVTGASKGIGAGIAKGLAAAGASVAVNYASSKESTDRVVSEIIVQGGKAFAAQGDVSKADDVKQLFAQVVGEFGGPDVLVNNAGLYSFGPLESITEAEFHRQYNTNVRNASGDARGGEVVWREGPAVSLILEPLAHRILVRRWLCKECH
jgi:3-oxoacyl-[acyl-carrier protein] reductase